MAHPRISASAPTSRRSSYGSHFNVNKDNTSPSHNNNNNNNIATASNPSAKSAVDAPSDEVKLEIPTSDELDIVPEQEQCQDPVDETKVFNRV